MKLDLPASLADELVPLLRDLVAIESVNPSLVPGGRGEAALAAFVAEWLRRFGLEPVLEEVCAGRPNVVAVARGTGGGRSILLNAHLDTVGVAGMAQPYSAEIQDGRLYGRGAMDTKGGLATFMLATAAAASADLPGDVIFAGVIDEEYASIGTEALLTRTKADAAIVAEATGLEIQTCHKGFVWLEIETAGLAAHGSRLEEGKDAIAKMGKFLVSLEDFGKRLASDRRHAILGPGSVHASLITGGQELSSYPASCRVSIERRTLPGETADSVKAELQDLLDRIAATDPDFKATCRVTFSREPLSVNIDSSIVRVLGNQMREQLGREPQLGGSAGWTDAALLTAAGIPSVVFGPAGEGVHGLHEWVDLKSVEECYSVVSGAINEFCSKPSDSLAPS